MMQINSTKANEPNLNVGDGVNLHDGSQFCIETIKVVPGQIGLAFQGLCLVAPYETNIREGDSVFIKLPAAPKNKADIGGYYRKIKQRFEREFQNQQVFNNIALQTKTDAFTVAELLHHGEIVSVSSRGTVAPISKNQIPVLITKYINSTEQTFPPSQEIDSAKKWFKFANGIARILQLVHNQGILHSFIVPRNILVQTRHGDSRQHCLVGFGYSALHHTRIETNRAVEDIDKPYIAPEVLGSNQANVLGALWFPVDVFSIGAVLFKYATNVDPPYPIPQDTAELKESVYKSMREHNDCLRRDNENILKIIDKCLRFDPNDRYSCAEELIESLEVAEGKRTAVTSGKNIKEILNKLTIDPDISPKKKHPFFTGVISKKLTHVKDVYSSIRLCHYEIYGPRDSLVTTLCHLLSNLNPGDIYRTMTLPSYWSDNNLGSNGRFLTMNKHIFRRNVRIERLFLVSQEFADLSDTDQAILRSHYHAVKDVTQEPGSIKSHESFNNAFDVRVKRMTQDKIDSFERDAQLVAYISKRNNRAPICLNFISQGDIVTAFGKRAIHRQIKKVRFWMPVDDLSDKRFEESKANFNYHWDMANGAKSLEDFIEGSGDYASLKDLLAAGDAYSGKKIRIATKLIVIDKND